jgi:hypothetical protein
MGRPFAATYSPSKFDIALINSLRAGPIEGRTDLEVAIALAALVHDELLEYGTSGGQQLADDEMATALAALRAVAKRIGLVFEPPYRNFTTFRNYWMRNDGYGSWQARRDMLDELFEPLHLELAGLVVSQRISEFGPRAAMGRAGGCL